MPKSVVSKRKSLTNLEIDKILSLNRAKLRTGKVISRAVLIDMFSIPNVSKDPNDAGSLTEMQKENLRLIKFQARVNNLMSESGLHLKSRNYYTVFKVGVKERTKKEIVRHAGKIDTAEVLEVELDQGMKTRTTAGTWGGYNRVYDNKGVRKKASVYLPSRNRREIAKNRVKHY